MDKELKHIRYRLPHLTDAQWTSKNPILKAGEVAFSTDKGMYKLGDGTSNWAKLSYNNAINADVALRVKNTLTIQTNGKVLGSYDGSTSKTLNITPANIGAALLSHYHDDRYYTESEIDTKLSGKSDSSHTHNYAGSSNPGGIANASLQAHKLVANSEFEFSSNTFRYLKVAGKAGSAFKVNDGPTAQDWHILRMTLPNTDGYYTDLAIPASNNTIHYKKVSGGIAQKWVAVLDELNYINYALPKTGGTVSAGSNSLTVNSSSVKLSGTIQIGDLVIPENEAKKVFLDMSHPVGSTLITLDGENPGNTLGGTWELTSKGRAIVGYDPSDEDFSTVGNEVGEKTVTLSEENLPAHFHTVGAHSHKLGEHTHTVPAHSHGLNSHTHSVPAHNHGLNNHTHTVPNHAHSIAARNVTAASKSLVGQFWNIAGQSEDTGFSHSGICSAVKVDDARPYPGTVKYAQKEEDALRIDATHSHTVAIPAHNTNSSGTCTTGGNGEKTANSSALTSGKAAGSTANSSVLTTGESTGQSEDSEEFNTGASGSGIAHNNIQPSKVFYIWLRTA